MEVATARAHLGLDEDASWDDVRVAYRARIAEAHPDHEGGDTALAALLNEAYATLREARDRPPAPPPRSGRRAGARRVEEPPPPEVPPEVLDGDTVHLAVPPDEAFVLLLDACHRIGDITYVDRSCAIFETLVRVEGEGMCSLVITLQGRAHGTDAFCTLEAIEHVGAPPVRGVVERLLEALRQR